MALFTMRDSWNVWRRKVDEALGGSVEPIKSVDVTYDNTDSGLTATNVQSAIDEIANSNSELTEKIDIVGNLFTTTTKVVDSITHNVATTVATLENLPIGTYVVSGQFNSDSAMNGGGLIQFSSSGVIQNGTSCNTMINQGFKANAGLTGIFSITNDTNQINLQVYTATADLTVSSARLTAIRIA